ncbi:hypothetical protein TNCV_2742061 [Trichonephila clavipes]|nr:hypothetical protein TNCV_2742061 [Trichonephila clavipes]
MQEESNPVDDKMDEDEDNNNNGSSRDPANANAFSVLETAMEWCVCRAVLDLPIPSILAKNEPFSHSCRLKLPIMPGISSTNADLDGSADNWYTVLLPSTITNIVRKSCNKGHQACMTV